MEPLLLAIVADELEVILVQAQVEGVEGDLLVHALEPRQQRLDISDPARGVPAILCRDLADDLLDVSWQLLGGTSICHWTIGLDLLLGH